MTTTTDPPATRSTVVHLDLRELKRQQLHALLALTDQLSPSRMVDALADRVLVEIAFRKREELER